MDAADSRGRPDAVAPPPAQRGDANADEDNRAAFSDNDNNDDDDDDDDSQACRSILGGDTYAAGTSTDGSSSPQPSSSSSSSGSESESVHSVHSDHARDYYDGGRRAWDSGDDSGGDGRPGGVYFGGGESEASSIRSLRSCEVVVDSRALRSRRARVEGDRRPESHRSEGGGSRYSGESASSHDEEDDDDDSLGFPPGHITRLDQLNLLQNHGGIGAPGGRSLGRDGSECDNINPSVIPSYFFCPISGTIMRDPVITPDGNTFERRCLLRSLVLEAADPVSGNPLSHEEIVDDRLVRHAIDKARKEAWVRYVVEFEDEEVDRIVEREEGRARGRRVRKGVNGVTENREGVGSYSEDDCDAEDALSGSFREADRVSVGPSTPMSTDAEPAASQHAGSPEHDLSQQSPPRSQSPPQRMPPTNNVVLYDRPAGDFHPGGHPIAPFAHPAAPPSPSSPPSPATVDSANGDGVFNHGWSVPLGVHGVICDAPGLVVTSDVHRRSNPVRRKVIRKSLADDVSGVKSKKKMKLKRMKSKTKHDVPVRVTTSVVMHDLVLPPGSHVEVLETVAHGGRVRGRVVWEEEVAIETDHDLALLLEEEEVRRRAMARPTKKTPLEPGTLRGAGKKTTVKSFFRRKSSTQLSDLETGGVGGDPRLPFTSELFDSRLPHHSPRPASRSPSPLATIKYGGWISLQWASGDGGGFGTASDEDSGPWTRPLPLGVYRIGGGVGASVGGSRGAGSSVKQLPLYDAPDSDSNIVDFLVRNQCLEVVETRVMVMRRRDDGDGDRDRSPSVLDSGRPRGRRAVRARCMVPVVVPPPMSEEYARGGNGFAMPGPPQRRFRGGWITLDGGMDSVAASPIPTGAYVVTTNDPLLSCDADSRIKSILPSGSCMEVDATRIEFEEKERTMKCTCGREGEYHSIAVRALIASGGYVTLFVVSVGMSGTRGGLCACGRLVQQTYAEPVPLGTYRMTRPAVLTSGIGRVTPALVRLGEDSWVRVLETRVEDGCVRGRVSVVVSGGKDGVGENGEVPPGERRQSLAGWVSLFEPPSYRWAEPTLKGSA